MIEYTLDKDDLKFSMKSASIYAGKKMKNIHLIKFFYFLFLASAIYTFSMVVFGYKNWPSFVLSDFDWLVGSLVLAMLSIVIIVRISSLSRLELISRGHVFPINVQVDLKNDGVEVRTQKSLTWLSWDQIDAFDNNDSYLIFYSYASNAIAIPKRKVTDPESLNELINTATDRLPKLL